MAVPLEVFIGSSGEAVKSGLVGAILSRLEKQIGQKARLTPWNWAFELGDTNIEALEKAAKASDFAILVLTPDDLGSSRGKTDVPVPRDNVVFEIGLFMGALGRDRCYVIHEERDGQPDLKIPSDLLGVTMASFSRRGSPDLDFVLQSSCRKVSDAILRAGARFKPSPEFVAAHATTQSFLGAVEGPWWERVTFGDVTTLSFFRIEPESASGSISLGGKSYDKAGSPIGSWSSNLARLQGNSKILYHWTGRHTSAELANIPFNGYGEMEFDRPAAGSVLGNGDGRFWNVDEGHPERTIIKPMELRRIMDPKTVAIMTDGSKEQKRALVIEVLGNWDKQSRW